MRTVPLKILRIAGLAILVLGAFDALPPASRSFSPQPAPPFDLPLIGGHGDLRSDDLFPAHELTFLVFWDSGCPHCIESLLQCETFYESQSPESVAVVGLHGGQADPFEVERLLEVNGIHFPQVWDIGGEAAQNYSVPSATFTLVLVNRVGQIVARRIDPAGDILTVLEEMRSEGLTMSRERWTGDQATVESQGAGSFGGLVCHGDARLRFLSIDSKGTAAVGPYGEELQPGNSFLYRFDLDVSRRITRRLRAGGLLRISNEDEKILETGPDYLGSRWGSAFAEIRAGGFLFRAGYYEIYMTPLTLMRWDWADNPRIGGNAGCGCGAAAGVLLIESLEELAPELVFEGGLAAYRRSDLEVRLFYAIPRRAKPTRFHEVLTTGADRASYSLETYGFETVLRRADPRTASDWRVGLRLTGAFEDDRSLNFVRLGYPDPESFASSMIASADWRIPLARSVNLQGEWILWNQSEENAEACCDTTLTSEGRGGVASIVFDRDLGWEFRFDYIYLDSGFYSPFAALSYSPNRTGVRFSGRFPLFGNAVSGSLFYKKLHETRVSYPGSSKEQHSLFGASVDFELPVGLGGSVGWLDDGRWRKGSVAPVDDVRKAFVVGARYRFDKMSSLQLDYQRVKRETVIDDDQSESTADLYSVYLSARF